MEQACLVLFPLTPVSISAHRTFFQSFFVFLIFFSSRSVLFVRFFVGGSFLFQLSPLVAKLQYIVRYPSLLLDLCFA